MRRPFRTPAALAVLLLLAACASGPEPSGGDGDGASPDRSARSAPLPEGVEAIALDGSELRPPELPEDVRASYEANLAAAQADHDADPGSVESTIWLGRRTAYLGRYREAIEIFSRGIEQHPEDPRLYRHRGHRYITTRQLDRAVADLRRASELAAGKPDEVEPDGLPNDRNIPTSTLQTNIWYHLGLAHYLKGEFDEAATCYRECLKWSKNPDMLCATSHWLYTTLRRTGDDAGAAALLEPVDASMDVIENHAYHRLLLLYKGELQPADLADGEDSIQSATAAYGVARWHAAEGRETEAQAMLRTILDGSQWAAFGYIAAEADVVR